MSISFQGSSNRRIYDNCDYEKSLYESTSPLAYMLNFNAHENCSKCIYDKFYTKYQLVDVESELKNLGRPLSRCDQNLYGPACNRSGLCVSTFDNRVPITPDPNVCPIVYNNLRMPNGPGYHLGNPQICRR
jgi:hypothetical protein